MDLKLFLAAAGQAGSPALAVDVKPNFIQMTTANGLVNFPVQMSAAATGGTPPYTYRWYRASGSSEIRIAAGSTAAQIATVESSGEDESQTAFIRCVVTDDAVTSAESVSRLAGAAHGTVP